MARATTTFVCQNCGAVSSRWAGKCSSCDAWNSITEEVADNAGVGGAPGKPAPRGKALDMETLSADAEDAPRMVSELSEFDRVTGGGFVPGSATLVGGEPGIGKSTLLLQVACRMAENGGRALYFSGEEATSQVRLRARRLGLQNAPIGLAAATNVSDILATLGTGPSADLVIVDSIQTLWSDSLESAPGTVSQVRTCAQILIRYAKRSGAALVMVGHVTKDGQIAGPKVVEHMVDTVLYFEGDSGHTYRILRAVKNRFGATDEIGVFEMLNEGLLEVTNPSELFLGERRDGSPGAAVFAGIEGTRPVLVEIQALVAPSPLASPRRAVVGWDTSRLSMILAVLDARCGLRFSAHDVYLNVAGGLKITEPAADLAVAAALISSLSGIALSTDCVYFGEVSLSGAIRRVGHMPQRLKEARKLGFISAVGPEIGGRERKKTTLNVTYYGHLTDLTTRLLSSGSQRHMGSGNVGHG